METPKEKAEILVEKFRNEIAYSPDEETAQQNGIDCAKIAVEELIKESSDRNTTIRFKGCNLTDKEYWQEVLNELNKL